MKKPKIYLVETRKKETEILACSIKDAEEYVWENESEFSFDMSGYFKVKTTKDSYTIDVEFDDELHFVNNICVRNDTLNYGTLNIPYTPSSVEFLVENNKKRIKNLLKKINTQEL